MRIEDSGLLNAARFVASPNADERPPGCRVDAVIIHGISLPPGEFGGPWIEALFTNTLDPKAHPYFAAIAGLPVSSHLLIRRDGGLVQFVPFHRRAWHAGASCLAGREACNDYAIGIELEGVDEMAYEDVQYRVLAEVLTVLRLNYPAITPERIVGHSDIAPQRKTDPGPAFDWARLRDLMDDSRSA